MHLTLFQHGMTILLWAGWALVTIGVGRMCILAFGVRFVSFGEHLFFSAGIGLIVVGYAVFFLGTIGLLSTLPLCLLLAALGLAAFWGWRHNPHIQVKPPAGRVAWDYRSVALLGFVLLAGFLLVLAPETGKDALIYHLAVPKLYLAHHGFYFIPGNVFAGYPLLGEMHYLLALFLRNDILAKTIHFSLLCGILLGIGQFIRFQMRENAFPALAMLLFASIPSVFAVSHTAYNDLFVAFFTLAAVYAYLRWSETGLRNWIILCGIFTGSAAACKYTALMMAPLGVLGILLSSNRSKTDTRQVFFQLASYILALAVVGCPFYLKNWIMTGNPVYPFFYDIFGGRGWDSDQARVYDTFIAGLGMGRTWADYLLLPWNLSLRAKADSPQFDGILGPAFLITLPFLFGRRHWEAPVKVLITYVLVSFLFWATSAQQLRYLIPLFLLTSILVAAVMTKYRDKKTIFRILILFVCGSLAFNAWHIARDFAKTNPLAVVIGTESREAFLTRLIPPYPMYSYVNRELPADSRIFLIYMKNFTFLCERACYADAMFETHTLQKILREAPTPEGVNDRLRKAGFTHLLYDDAYLTGERSPMSPDEKRLFAAFRDSCLSTVRQYGSYRLEALSRPPANLPLIR